MVFEEGKNMGSVPLVNIGGTEAALVCVALIGGFSILKVPKLIRERKILVSSVVLNFLDQKVIHEL